MKTRPESTEATDNNNSRYVVEIEHLQKSFGNKQVLKDINIQITKGENLAVLGRSGVGKSVLIKCMVRLIEPDNGKIIILGQNVTELDDATLNRLRKKIGLLFQSAALYDSMTVKENLEFPFRELHSKPQKEIDAMVKEVLENVGLTEAIDKMPSELSGGMRKRIGLARTLIFKPDIMLYDEPSTGLDPITSREINMLILEIQKKYDTSSIIITHDIECAKMTANRIVLINDGECVAEGTFEELKKSKDKWVRSYFD